ncbi:7510_t:CDS:2 [Ambispora gerdemannii]|uniref:7510_t:CDS:1 n=1 Tax=Ambispora gerdemannii TaxID=144530 RepID=A0A9N9H7Y7_9GLOM|nr:7510_t:CDS:2 [Ambispora gerdemannii]
MCEDISNLVDILLLQNTGAFRRSPIPEWTMCEDIGSLVGILSLQNTGAFHRSPIPEWAILVTCSRMGDVWRHRCPFVGCFPLSNGVICDLLKGYESVEWAICEDFDIIAIFQATGLEINT